MLCRFFDSSPTAHRNNDDDDDDDDDDNNNNNNNNGSSSSNNNLPTPWIRVLLEKLIGSQLVKKFLAFYGT